MRRADMSDNFTEMDSRLNPKKNAKIYSASGDGKIPFIACDDIAAVAFRALTDEKPHNTDHMILGPELLTYQDVIDPSLSGRMCELTSAGRTDSV
jgi:festuclavine dehydrogenase